MDDWNHDAEWQDVPRQSFPFLIDRRELEAILKAAGDALPTPANAIVDPPNGGEMHVRTGGLPEDAISFAQAMVLLAPIIGGHYPELDAKRALVDGAKDERMTGYGRPDRLLHYEALQASLWDWCQIVSQGVV